ncbi:MAG: DUF922 domain-containing protein [Rhizobiaceae bacterium]
MTRLSKLFSAVLVCVLAGVISADQAFSKIIVREKTSYYPIKGTTGVELAEEMLRGGQKNINLRHAIAATAASYEIGDAEVKVINGRCKVTFVEVILDIEYTYPRWTNKSSGSRKLQSVWNQFFKELVRHEQTHGRIAKEGAKQLERELERISGTVAFGCNDFGAFSSIRLNALGRQLKNRQLAFDRRENFRVSRISRLQTLLINAE